MSIYNATYTSSGHVQPAMLSLLKDKAAITFSTPEGNRTTYWMYDNIAPNDASSALFAYTAYPPQTLEVLDKALAGLLAMQVRNSKKTIVKKRNQSALVLLTALLLFFAALYFFVLPRTASILAARVPLAYEKKLGNEMYDVVIRDFEVDAKRSAYVSAFFDALHIPSDYAIKITVVKSKVANAFALPGGHIIIYDKLLNGLTAYPQLAAVLAHEFIHVQDRHSLKSLFRQASTALLFSALIGDAGAVGAAVLSSADKLKTLSYSRSLESEADAKGLQVVTARNIDGKGFIQLFKILQSEPDAEGPEWTSSHPQLETRIRNIKQSTVYKQQQPHANALLQQWFLKLKTAD